MTRWNTLALGEFIKAKRLLAKVGDIVIPLYSAALPEDAESVISEAQKLWSEFLALAAPEESDVERDVSRLSLPRLQELTQDFFGIQAGVDRK